MTEALRAQLKEKLMDAQLCSDQHERDGDEAQQRLGSMNIHLGIMGLSLDNGAQDSTSRQVSTPPHTSRKNVSPLI